jgi:hypothetical protein
MELHALIEALDHVRERYAGPGQLRRVQIIIDPNTYMTITGIRSLAARTIGKTKRASRLRIMTY